MLERFSFCLISKWKETEAISELDSEVIMDINRMFTIDVFNQILRTMNNNSIGYMYRHRNIYIIMLKRWVIEWFQFHI